MAAHDHDLDGYSHFWDNVHSVFLAHNIKLQIRDGIARLIIGPADGVGDPEIVVFTRAMAVSTLAIVAQVLEEQAFKAASAGKVTPIRSYVPCPECARRGGDFDNEENWVSCDTCGGVGIIRNRKPSSD